MQDQSLPPGWILASLGEVTCAKVDQSGPQSEQFTYVDISSIDNGNKTIAAPKTLELVDAPSRARQELRQGDVVVSMTRPNLNAVAIVPPSLNGAIASTGFNVLRANGILPEWIYFAVQTPAFVEAMSALVQGALYPAVRPRDVRQFNIPLPPLAEQRRIVAEIETQFARLDVAEAALERARANSKRYVAAALAGAAATGWPRHQLSEVSEIQGGIQKQPKRAPVANAFPFLRVANVLRGRLDLNDVHQVELFNGELERLRLRPGDLLVVEGNGSPSEIGRMAMWDGSIENCVHQNHLIRVRPAEALLPQFLEIFWNSPIGKQAVQSVASSTSGLYTLSTRKIGSIAVPVPPIDIQCTLVQEVANQLGVAASLDKAIVGSRDHAALLRQSILQRAFSGQLVPQDPDDEPASVLLERIAADRASAAPPRRKAAARRTKATRAEVQHGLL